MRTAKQPRAINTRNRILRWGAQMLALKRFPDTFGCRRLLVGLQTASVVCVLVFSQTSFAEPNVRHVVAYHKEGEFAGWPANGGLWMWGDEILVGYERWTHDPNPSSRHHTKTPRLGESLSRSKDGGSTWQVEDRSLIERPGPDMNFLGKGFALRLWRQSYFTSSNRGRDWHGPFELPAFRNHKAYARSNYIITSRHSAFLFLSTLPQDEAPARSFLARMDNNPPRFAFVSWIGNDYLDRSRVVPQTDTYRHAIMPYGLQIGDRRYVCAVRQRVGSDRWSDLYETRDDGETWSFLSTIERGSDNPISLLSLGGDVVTAIYGWRSKPYGLRAKISRDAGRTWSDHIVLRDDALNNDIGYTRAAVRSDGTVVIAYYYATEDRPEQHISVTFWRPSAPPSPTGQE